MKKFKVFVNLSGWASGYHIFEVEAETKELAMDDFWSGKEVSSETNWEDPDQNILCVEEIVE